MDIITASESEAKSSMSKAAFAMNMCIQNQSNEGSFDRFNQALYTYSCAKVKLEILDDLKTQMKSFEGKNEVETEPTIDNGEQGQTSLG